MPPLNLNAALLAKIIFSLRPLTHLLDGLQSLSLLLGLHTVSCEASHGLLPDVGRFDYFCVLTLYLLLQFLFGFLCLQGDHL